LICIDNQLTSLDVSKNTVLTYLDCDYNQLTSLDVSKNAALESFYCGVNQLTSLDVSKNTALTDLGCAYNQLTSLDVSKNTVLTYLFCHVNQLTSLDVSNNTALEWLDCSGNQLTSLDVSKNTVLTYLECDNNQIKGSAMDALVESLPNVSNGEMYVIWNEDEGNVMTITQVAAAKAKGWIPYYYDGTDWQEYAGSDPSGIEALKNSKVEKLKYYDLQGRRVVNPTKGVYIINGRKVVLKNE
jgi:Leucine-rich repeat (LRR) protein